MVRVKGYVEAQKPYRRRKCDWVPDPDMDCWNTQCGEAWTLIDGTPSDNRMNYCLYCGHETKERQADNA